MNIFKLIFLMIPICFSAQISYEGKIGDYPVEMVLNMNEDSANGVYVYSKYNNPIFIHGSFKEEKLTLFESESGKNTAQFIFENFDENKDEISGNWTNLKKGNASLKVYLKKKDNQNEILQAESTEQFYFKTLKETEENPILIFEKKSGKLIQKMELGECMLGSTSDISIGDFSFDGYEDFSSCLQTYAGPNTSKSYFLYDPVKNRFFESEFTGVSLEFDSKTKRIKEVNQCCAGASIVENIYKVQNNKMKLVEEHCYKYDEKLQKHIEKKPKDCY